MPQEHREGLALPGNETHHWNHLIEMVPMVPSNLESSQIGGSSMLLASLKKMRDAMCVQDSQ